MHLRTFVSICNNNIKWPASFMASLLYLQRASFSVKRSKLFWTTQIPPLIEYQSNHVNLIQHLISFDDVDTQVIHENQL